MSIHKKGRREARQGNRHLAKLGRPGLPKKYSKEVSARRHAKNMASLSARKARGAKS